MAPAVLLEYTLDFEAHLELNAERDPPFTSELRNLDRVNTRGVLQLRNGIILNGLEFTLSSFMCLGLPFRLSPSFFSDSLSLPRFSSVFTQRSDTCLSSGIGFICQPFSFGAILK